MRIDSHFKNIIANFNVKVVNKNHQIFVIAGLGGSTSNALIELVDILKRIDINPNVIVLKPFAFEGKDKVELANSVIEKLNDSLNNLKIFDNNDIESLGDKNLPMKEMFTLMDKNIFEFIIKKASM